ncbi:serpin B8-like [Macrobrachium rosenbergii]|uniref:serpin B8-like n=1 Tax=Macrobrachium rosenbergii TaxID=79674 RepID=UPI0034D5A719
MRFISAVVLLAFAGGVHLQCLTPDDSVRDTSVNTDLSNVADFSLSLFKQLSPLSSRKNFFFSPYSIWTALTLAYFGSAGNTQGQLEAALNVPDKLSALKLWRSLEDLYEKRLQASQEYTFRVASRAYFDTGVQLRSCLKDVLPGEIQSLSLVDAPASASTINTFVSETTNGRIKSIVTPGDLSNAQMVLVNAAFFKGSWKYQFDASQTLQRDFHISPKETVATAMMSQEGSFLYGESEELGARILELPYAGNTVSMFLLLPSSKGPADRAGFAQMVSSLSGSALRRALSSGNLWRQEVEVLVPKFKVEVEVKDELVMSLKTLGITDLFDKTLANMTSFTPYAGMSVDKTVHKAFVEVNEEGTEAAAATALISTYARSEPTLFACNEPFVYIIYDIQTDNILFLGTFRDPRGL